jgi:hypothetical protein
MRYVADSLEGRIAPPPADRIVETGAGPG